MPISTYLKGLRAHVGHDHVLLPVVSVSILDERGCVLLGKDAEMGLWTLPGGAIWPGEQPADAAVRECFEETGFFVAIESLIGVFGGPEFLVKYRNGDVSFFTTIAFQGTIIDQDRQPSIGQMSELGYFSQSDCDVLTLSDPTRLILKSTFARGEQPIFQSPNG
ncbi:MULTISPECIES: NUDIX domain-containing protein [unclassified Bradyrhizobium]|uniref:NUDIX domain-containing protein n=1 Tax=unclassified Bradyrhizobium TaxID=2631580 RepID=UPI002916ACE9|nr:MULTISPECIES: NUDIX domain-containing protein [unclassified Bradyrhizobium]